MKIVNGKYNKAIVHSNDVEEYALAQLKMICDNEIFKDSNIIAMCDIHPGNVGPIGLTMTFQDKIMPNLLGVDIGCGMTCSKIDIKLNSNSKNKKLDFYRLDKIINETIPSGKNIRNKLTFISNDVIEECENMLKELHCFKQINLSKAIHSLGTLGGGNHFIEMDKDENNNVYLIVHSGSRHLGKEITEYYLSKGSTLLKEQYNMNLPYALTWLSNDLLSNYIHDVKIAQKFAQLNRDIIIDLILKNMKLKEIERFSSVHNYIEKVNDENLFILRKGAISSKINEKVIIPINMKDGVILGIGKGNKNWNESAPHGAGRLMNRSEVKNHYTVSNFKKEMQGIHCSCINANTLDEAPFAYRSIDTIKQHIEDTINIDKVLKPIYNYKAGE